MRIRFTFVFQVMGFQASQRAYRRTSPTSGREAKPGENASPGLKTHSEFCAGSAHIDTPQVFS